MKNAPSNLHYSQHVAGKGKECFAVACEAHMEGIVGKKADSIYSGTRNGDWIKLKCDKRQEFVIGYTLSDKKSSGISSLLLGVYEDNEFVYVGGREPASADLMLKSLRRHSQVEKNDSPSQLLLSNDQ